jgi:hypothetical protein
MRDENWKKTWPVIGWIHSISKSIRFLHAEMAAETM